MATKESGLIYLKRQLVVRPMLWRLKKARKQTLT